jgi:hypothetical protein
MPMISRNTFLFFLFVFLPHSESGRRSLNKKKKEKKGNVLV